MHGKEAEEGIYAGECPEVIAIPTAAQGAGREGVIRLMIVRCRSGFTPQTNDRPLVRSRCKAAPTNNDYVPVHVYVYDRELFTYAAGSGTAYRIGFTARF
jgi:hypothetical protein